jgi:hypothetical protein
MDMMKGEILGMSAFAAASKATKTTQQRKPEERKEG